MSENSTYPPEEKALNAAIAKAQLEMPALVKDRTAKAGSFSYNYIDLASVIRICGPVLAKHGLAVVQRLENPSGGGPSIRTELRHADGGCIAASFPLGEWKTMQELGSASSYVRRYSYMAIVGVAAAEEDDDAQSVAPVSEDAPPRAAGAGASLRGDSMVTETPQFKAPELPENEDYAEDLTAAQRRKIFAIRTKLIDAGLFTEEDFKAQLVMSFGVDSVTGLSKEQASDLIGRLLNKEEELV